MLSSCFVPPVQFIQDHALLLICSLPKTRITFSRVLAIRRAPLHPILFLD
jgi:hypothetical protein